MKECYLTICLIFLTVGLAQAQFSPETGSAERKAIVDGLRVVVQSELKKPVMFGDVRIKVKGGWAVVETATPLKPDLTPFDYRGSVSSYAKCINRGGDDCGDPQYSAILRKTGSKWKVVKSGSGATDVWIGYACSKIRGCPRELQ